MFLGINKEENVEKTDVASDVRHRLRRNAANVYCITVTCRVGCWLWRVEYQVPHLPAARFSGKLRMDKTFSERFTRNA